MTEKSLPEYLLSPVSVKRGAGAGVGVYLIFKECCFRVRVRFGLTLTLILTLKHYSLKKKR